MKKSALKNRIKSYWGKHKTTIFVVALSFQLAIGLTIYFLFGRISPNDNIFVPKEGSVAFLMNENPRFSVDFGKVKEPDKQWVRFEAQTSAKNPFEEEKGNIFTKIAKLFQKKERYGIEMSLVGVDLKGEELKKYGDEVILVADVIGTDSVKTSTELIDVGREIGVYEDQEVPVSKQTVLNKDVADGVDLEYQILKGLGLKEEIIIRDLEAYKDSCKKEGCSLPVNEFVFDLKMDSDVELREGWFTVDGQSTSTYYFVDSKGRYIAHFLPNFAIDNINNKTFDVNLKVEKGEDNNYRAKVTVNLEWLLSSERVFPVRIDPSIVHDDTADFSGGIFNRIESVTGPKIQLLSASGSGEYTSSSMDMGSSMSGATLSWTPSGVNTGNGETPYSTTGLVAQWNFNETSGTTAVSGGSCGTTCNGTLTNFASTGSQDAAAGTGWTANNKRWGAGALMFDGTNDYVSCTDANCGGSGKLDNVSGSFSIETWVEPNICSTASISPGIVDKFDTTSSKGYLLYNENYSGANVWTLYDPVNNSYLRSISKCIPGEWTYIVAMYDSSDSTKKIYINGVLEATLTGQSAFGDSSSEFNIGRYRGGGFYFSGIIDSTRAYARALSASEVLSNYQAGNIEFQYRVSADNSTWSSWTSYNDGALMFDESNDYVSIADNNSLDITSTITLEAWINLNNVTSSFQTIVGKRDASATEVNYALRVQANQLTFYYYANGAYQIYSTSNASLVPNTWYHIVATFNGSTVNIYKNSTLLSGSCIGGTCNVAMVADNNTVGIGRPGDLASQYFSGIIDSVKIYSRVLNSTEISTNYAMADGESPSSATNLVGYWKLNEGSGTTATNVGTCGTGCNGTLTNFFNTAGKDVTSNSGWTSKTKRGSDSLWESFDNPYLYETDDSGSIGYWPMDEASGTGAYILDKTETVGYSVFATGGTVTTSGGYTIHKFTSSGTFVVNGSGNVEVLVIAGGGGGAGGGLVHGGGGAGGMVSNSSLAVSSGNTSVTVGAGGIAGTAGAGGTGGNSVFSTITAYGGGAGITPSNNGLAGGNGGGAAVWDLSGTRYGGTASQGYNGGNVNGSDTEKASAGGGGGGAGQVGGNGGLAVGNAWQAGVGGAGASSSITGTATYYAGGGGGSGRGGLHAVGGIGGGGNGGASGGTNGLGGGGGGGAQGAVGYAGGSGVVIIRYPSTYQGSYVYSNGTPTNTTYVGGKSAGARSFNGSSSYINFPDSSAFDVSNLTIEAWVYSTNFNHNGFIFEKGPINTQYSCFFNSTNTFYFRTYNSTAVADDLTFTTGTYFNNNAWNHVACTYDGSNKKVYVNGVLAASKAYTQTLRTGQTGQRIGAYGGATPAYFFNGIIDEVRVFNTALSASAIVSDYTKGIMNKSSVVSQKPGSIKMEGASSTQLTSGSGVVDSNTVALWHLDERGGTGAYIKDSSANANNGTPTGTTYTNSGKVSGARSFNGTSNGIAQAASSNVNIAGDISVEAWIKPTSFATNGVLIHKEAQYTLLVAASSGYVSWADSSNWSYANFGYRDIGLVTGVWQHIAVTKTGAVVSIYLNGVLKFSQSFGGAITGTTNIMHIGCYSNATTCSSNYYNGSIDEMRVSNIARTANEIANSYRLGRDTYVNKAVDVRDLSSSTTLPIYIAGDRPGSYLNTIWGETGYSNYQPDANTIGLWHMDEIAGSGAYIQSATGNNNGTPTGTTYTGSGKLGGARSFNGTSDIIATTALATSPNAETLELWINPSAKGTIVAECDNTSCNSYVYTKLGINADNTLIGHLWNLSGTLSFGKLTYGQWYHIAMTYDGTTLNGYLNGNNIGFKTGSRTAPATLFQIFGRGNAQCSGGFDSCATYYSGVMDEVRYSNTARTADEIRQSYEIGLRTHSVQIDFGASLASGNLITGSGDTSFSIDATVYGLDALGSGIYKDEKIIVKENYDGTEYIAQGTVSAVTSSTGAVTVSSWDTGSTFPSAGYTVNADVFKWQKEYIPIKNRTVSTHVNAVNLLSFAITDGDKGRNIWIDDLRSTSGHLSTYTGEELTFPSSGQYFQYKAIFNTWDSAVTPYMSQVQLDYQAPGPTMDQIMRHGKWFNSSGAKQPFWWGKVQ